MLCLFVVLALGHCRYNSLDGKRLRESCADVLLSSILCVKRFWCLLSDVGKYGCVMFFAKFVCICFGIMHMCMCSRHGYM